MNRDEAKEQYKAMLLAGQKNLVENGNDIVDLIYDDFKSRTCEKNRANN